MTQRGSRMPSVGNRAFTSLQTSCAKLLTLYVDGVAQPFGNHDDQISATGVLDWPFEQHTGDNIVLGNYDRGIDATFNDFRFTPAVLDPLQMLSIGQLD